MAVDKRPNQLDAAVALQLSDIATLNQTALPDKMVQTTLNDIKILFGAGGGIELKTNNVDNVVQTILNLTGQGGISIVDNGDGTVFISGPKFTNGNGTNAVRMLDTVSADGNDAIALNNQTLATGNNSIACGDSTESIGENSVAQGKLIKSTHYNERALGGTIYSKRFEVNLSNKTFDPTPTELFLDGETATQRLTIDNNVVWFYSYKVCGIDDGSGGIITYEGKGMIAQIGGVVSIYGNTDTLLNAQATMIGSTVVASADNTNFSLKIEVTDNSGSTESHWSCSVDITETIGI